MPEIINYWVTAVRFNQHQTHIEWLQCCENKGTTMGSPQNFSRQTVIDAITNKKLTFMTAVKESKGNWARGQMIYAFSLTAHFLKTKSDSSTKDNLDNLPTF